MLHDGKIYIEQQLIYKIIYKQKEKNNILDQFLLMQFGQ